MRFVQIYHNNWDTHGNVAGRLPDQCRDVDQPTYGLIKDLKLDGKAGGVKSGTKVKGIRLVSGDHPIDGKVNGRGILIKAEFVRKA